MGWRVNFESKGHLKNFVVVIEDCGCRTCNSNEGDALRVGRQLDGALGGNGVTRVEDSGPRKGTEHCLQIKRIKID